MKKLLLLKFALFILLFYSFLYIVSQFLSVGLDEVQAFVLSFGAIAPIVYSVVLFLGLTVPLNPVSDFLVINLGVIAFPYYVSILFTFIAHSFAITANYFVGKWWGRKILKKVVNKDNSEYLDKFISKLTIKRLFFIRFFVSIATIFGADIVSYVSGMRKLPFTKYFLASIFPWTFLATIYFSLSSYLINKSLALYFLPALLIVGLPILSVFLYRKIK